jgi:hypothetical protein
MVINLRGGSEAAWSQKYEVIMKKEKAFKDTRGASAEHTENYMPVG